MIRTAIGSQPVSSRRLPLRDGVFRRLFQTHFVVDLLDPIERNNMMLPAGFGVAFGQHDLVLILRTIDRSDMRAVGAANFHVFLDLLSLDHTAPPFFQGLTRT